ncbi:MAG: glycerol kinase GlpK [Alphaproteobacteria bacterium]|nr:glycerol kinase GlpK [Alphaproteobacteria bacterium]
MRNGILAIDQGTTSTRAIVFDDAFKPQAVSQIELTQHYPQPGWVEHDLEEIWRATLQTCREAIDKAGGPSVIAAIGITNQRETTAVWDRATGAPLHRGIVWQDRRTAGACDTLRTAGHEAAVQAETGLLLDPYFSATKIGWILDAVPGARQRAEQGALAFGTIDSFLIWRLTNGRMHATDVTNAARTLLFALEPPGWSDPMCALFGVPRALLPEARPSAGDFGASDPSHFGRAIPIAGVAGDQQAALVGHGCLTPGRAKATYGTGCFLVMNAGARAQHSKNRLLATIGYQTKDQLAYALEGSIFSAGATIQWLRDGLKVIEASRESEALAASLKDNGGVYLVPAFAGLGAPQWNADARGAIVGLTRDTSAAHVVRAGVEAIAYQTHDLLEALIADGAPPPETLLVDGGVTANSWAMQFLADICAAPVERPAYQEVTALGAAKLAALGAGLIPDLGAVEDAAPRARWTPAMAAEERARLLDGWRRAVAGALAVARPAPTA